ncbi:MAG: hypothetical protein ACPGUF_07995, partial [Litorivicinus sp.]
MTLTTESSQQFIEHDSSGQLKFAQVIGGIDDTVARGRIQSIELVNGKYEITVVRGVAQGIGNHTSTSGFGFYQAYVGKVVRLATADRIPVYVMPAAGSNPVTVDYALKVKLSDLDWTATDYSQVLTMASGHGLAVNDTLALQADDPMYAELNGSVVATVTAVNGNQVTVDIRRGHDVFEGVDSVEIIRQGDQVGQQSWDLSGAVQVDDGSIYNVQVESGNNADIWKVTLAYTPTAVESAIFASEADGLDAAETLTKETFILPYRPLVNDRLNFREFVKGVDGAAFNRSADQATVVDVQEVLDANGDLIGYDTFVEVRYSDLMDPELIAGLNLQKVTGSGDSLAFDTGHTGVAINAAAETTTTDNKISAAEFSTRRAEGLERMTPRP